MVNTAPHSVSVRINDRPLELNAFASTIIANLVDAIVQSLRTEGEIRTIVIERNR